MQKKPLVVIVGAGYGGIRTALDFEKSGRANIILIDKSLYHSLPSQFYELATVFRYEKKRPTQKEFEALYHSASLPLKYIFRRARHVDFIQGQVEHIEPDHNLVHLGGARRLHYEWLVIALGSETNYFNIPHLENNAFGFKKPEEAFNIRDRIDELFFSAPKQKKITVVIGGAGPTGCEFAAEAVGYMRKLAETHRHPHGGWACILVEASRSILGASSPWIQKKARERLMKEGVTVLTESTITDVWPNLLYVKMHGEQKTIPFDALIWTAGVKGACVRSVIPGAEFLEGKHCFLTDEFLRVKPYSNIFALGDVAVSFYSRSKVPVPMTAQKAVAEGRYVARTIKSLIEDKKKELRAYNAKAPSSIIPLGGKYALLETPHFRLSGFFAWMVKYGALLRYLASIVSPWYALRFTCKEMDVYSKND